MFTDLNYRFDHSKHFTLDAFCVGNETRYINHKRIPGSNIDADSKSMASWAHKISHLTQNLPLIL